MKNKASFTTAATLKDTPIQPDRAVIFHRDGYWYPIMIFQTDTPEQIAEHALLNPGTTKVTDAVTDEVLWSLPHG